MTKFNKKPIYYSGSQDRLNRVQNLSMRSYEKVYSDYEIADSQEPTNFITEDQDTYGTPPSYVNMTAPTTRPSRPRAKKLAYSKEAEKLVVKFRDGKWWEYNGVPVEMWNDLKASNSTGKYLAASGLDTYDDMGPFNPDMMPEEIRVLFNS
jgi:hypothetical protein